MPYEDLQILINRNIYAAYDGMRYKIGIQDLRLTQSVNEPIQLDLALILLPTDQPVQLNDVDIFKGKQVLTQ